MSTQVKQVVFIGLAGVLILFMVWMLRPQTSSNQAPSSVGSAPISAGASGSGTQQPVDPALQQRVADLQAKVQQNPKDVAALTDLGNALFDLQQFPQAADTFSSAVELDPKNTDLHLKLGNAYFFQGMAKSAIREYRTAIDVDPKNAEPQFYLALALSHSNPPDVDAAIQAWQQVLKLAPGTDLATKSQSFIDAYQKQGK